MTCTSLLRRRPETIAVVVGAPQESQEPVREGSSRPSDAGHALVERLRGDDLVAQFLRFVFVGGSSTAVYAALFMTFGGLGYLLANVLATTASSVMANELHRRLTFHADERVGWGTAQLEAGGVSLFGLLATSLALGWLDATLGSTSPVLQISLVAAVTALIGLMRFVALRWIFRPTESAAQ